MAPLPQPSPEQPDLSIPRFFTKLKDPRRAHRRLHHLQDLIVIALCAVIAGAQDWQEIETFGRKRHAWLRGFLALPNGIPSHDTFERVFNRLQPQAFQACFRAWVRAISAALGIKHVAIDGKTLRGSGSAQLGPLHLVSAWATAQRLSLGQVAVDAKSNEITAIPALLELLDLKGALVTIDAMGCQKDIAAKVVAGGGHYALTVKLIFDTAIPHLLPSPGLRFAQWRCGTRICPTALGLVYPSVTCWTVGGAATPAAWNTRPAVPCNSLRNRNRLPVCSTSTYCTRSRSPITSAHSSSWPRASSRACSSCRSTSARNEQNTCPRIVSSRWW
jgi:predicted transposase YbfD/YdcC